MEVEFADSDLDRLETDTGFDNGLPPEAVRAYRKRMQAIRAARDERDLYRFASWNFKKLKGEKANQHQIRLNDQWRMRVEIKKGNPGNVLVIVAVEDPH